MALIGGSKAVAGLDIGKLVLVVDLVEDVVVSDQQRQR